MLLGLAVSGLLLLAPSVQAHFASFPIAADSVSIQTQGDPSTWQFEFSASNQEALLVLHDPATDGSSLLVRGTGANAGRTTLIRLDPANWTPDPGTGGYLYTDLTSAQGGVRNIELAPGSISILASGVNWPWEITGGQDSLWVEFWIGEELFCAEFSASNAMLSANAAGQFAGTGASAPLACQEPVCGNGVHELGEECDDGNFDNGDGCTDQCLQAACTSTEYASTWEAIQSIIIGENAIEGYQCNFCHGPVPIVGTSLVLAPDVAYQNIFNVPSANFFTDHKLVEPGEPATSFLYEKLLAGNQGVLMPSGQGNPMPVTGTPLSHEHLQAMSKWIRGGAPETGVVDGTAELLAACLPPATPLKITPPDPPPAGTGVQLLQTPWDLLAQSEDEVCMATYYDFTGTGLVPGDYQVDCPGVFGANNPTNKCFRYHGETLWQDPQSHHSIIHIYQGTYAVDYVDVPLPGDPVKQWGPFSYKKGANAGQACDPKAIDPASGANADCSGPVVSSVACTNAEVAVLNFLATFGPPDYVNNVTAPAFSGSQEPYYRTEPADGVFSILPMAGVVVWNSHAFNLTDQDSTMEQYLNIRLAGPEDRLYPLRGIFDAASIFSENVPAYQTQEVCRTYTIEQGAQLFHINSHTHEFGVKFRIWEPPNAPCAPDANGNGCFPGDPSQLIYLSTVYTDPVHLYFDPPKAYHSPNAEERTFRFCSLYDNGSTESSPAVKQQSTSPPAPANFGVVFPFIGIDGGPCTDATVSCLGGLNAGTPCGGNPAVCDSGVCDACPVRGGVTTKDEMFIFIGSYFVPEPGAALMALAALLTVAGLKRRSRTGGRG
ncbi:MAG: hypothetical protein NZ990_09875 [Myxococcota bacterium]|nr:hypothetical protein [Myxococcota bacterium]